MKKYKVDVIIPIYNSLEWLKVCVDALIKNTNHSILGKIYLMNDCHTKEVIDYLEEMKIKYDNLVEIEQNKENLGFLKTCNKGMKKSKSDYVLLLNTDCIVSKNAIEKMADAMSKDKKIGLLCPISSVAANLSFSIPEGMNFMQVNEIFEKNFKGKTFDACTVVGNCLMISRENIKKVGLFDEIFEKGYTEETDYQFKSMKKGMKAKVLIDTFVYHQSRVSFGESKEQLQIRDNHLKIFFERWGKEYHELLEKYSKNDPIQYIKNNIDYNSVNYNYEIKVKSKQELEIVSNMVNRLMLDNINVKVIVKEKILKEYQGIMLFNPCIKKGMF